jgi:hypothetical protein
MPTEWDTFQKGVALKELSEELGVHVMEIYDTRGRTGRVTYEMMFRADAKAHPLDWSSWTHEFTSMFEVYGFLTCVKAIRDNRLHVLFPRPKVLRNIRKELAGIPVPLVDMYERARELVSDNKESLEYRRGIGELLAAMTDDDNAGLDLAEATMTALKSLGYKRDVYKEEG